MFNSSTNVHVCLTGQGHSEQSIASDGYYKRKKKNYIELLSAECSLCGFSLLMAYNVILHVNCKYKHTETGQLSHEKYKGDLK